MLHNLGAKIRQKPWLSESLDRLLRPIEKLVKIPIFHCHMCGQCVLHSTGMVCPMTCPKSLRNGPCGGVRQDGSCEVIPEMSCVWVIAYERSQRLFWPEEIHQFFPPVDWSLQGSSSWINMLTQRDQIKTGCDPQPDYALKITGEHGRTYRE